MNLHPEKNLVFSYGTLKRGYPNHSIMQEIKASFITNARTKFKYPLVLAGQWNSPFLIDKKNYPDSYRIQGELFEVDKEGIARLDEFEGVGKGRYQRLKIEVCCTTEKEDAFSRKAWCYFRFESSENLLADSSGFIPFYGKKELKKYVAIHLRSFDGRNK